MPRNNEPGMPKANGKKDGQGKWTKYNPKGPATTIDWDEVSAPLIGELVQAVTRDGSALLLGKTRDGGALVITICAGDERAKFYAATHEELAAHVQNIISMSEA